LGSLLKSRKSESAAKDATDWAATAASTTKGLGQEEGSHQWHDPQIELEKKQGTLSSSSSPFLFSMLSSCFNSWELQFMS